MSLVDQLTQDMKTAMKTGDKARLSAVRMLISAVRYVGIDSGEMTDDKVIAVLQKEAKKRRESIEAYTNAGRTEQAEQEKSELGIIESYLPQMMGEDEVRVKVQALLQTLELRSMNYGEVMKIVMQELKGKADGGLVSKVVKEVYTQ